MLKTASRASRKKEALEAIPAFLRRVGPAVAPTVTVTVSGRRFATREDDRLPPPRDLPPLPPGLRYTEFQSEEGGFRQEPGVVLRRWARSDPTYVKQCAVALREHEEEKKRRAEAEVSRREANAARLRGMQRGPRVPDGHLRLRDALARVGSKLSPRHAKLAIDAAKMIHANYAVASNDATLARLRVVLEQYQPPAAKRGSKHEHPPDAVILFRGKGNPKKEGSSAHERWALLIKHHGRTVAEFLAAEGNATTLANAIKQDRAELKEKTGGKSEGDDAKVSRSDGAKLRDQAPKAAAMGSGKRDRSADAGRLPQQPKAKRKSKRS